MAFPKPADDWLSSGSRHDGQWRFCGQCGTTAGYSLLILGFTKNGDPRRQRAVLVPNDRALMLKHPLCDMAAPPIGHGMPHARLE